MEVLDHDLGGVQGGYSFQLRSGREMEVHNSWIFELWLGVTSIEKSHPNSIYSFKEGEKGGI